MPVRRSSCARADTSTSNCRGCLGGDCCAKARASSIQALSSALVRTRSAAVSESALMSNRGRVDFANRSMASRYFSATRSGEKSCAITPRARSPNATRAFESNSRLSSAPIRSSSENASASLRTPSSGSSATEPWALTTSGTRWAMQSSTVPELSPRDWQRNCTAASAAARYCR